MAKPILITGFEPFGGQKVNPSEIVARNLEGRLIAGRLVVVRILPVRTGAVRKALAEALTRESPEAAIGLGQAGGRTAVSIERVAVNLLDFDAADNAGEIRKNEPIQRGGPDARISPLPVADIIEAWAAAGVPAFVSNSAGTYICNQTLYELLGLAQSASPPIPAGFIHLPYLPAQAVESDPQTNPSMSLALMERAIEVLVETVVPWIERRLAPVPAL